MLNNREEKAMMNITNAQPIAAIILFSLQIIAIPDGFIKILQQQKTLDIRKKAFTVTIYNELFYL